MLTTKIEKSFLTHSQAAPLSKLQSLLDKQAEASKALDDRVSDDYLAVSSIQILPSSDLRGHLIYKRLAAALEKESQKNDKVKEHIYQAEENGFELEAVLNREKELVEDSRRVAERKTQEAFEEMVKAQKLQRLLMSEKRYAEESLARVQATLR